MNLMAEVARLKELRKIALDCPDDGDQLDWCKYSDELRNAAPMLLDALAKIRPGDAAIIGLFVEFMKKHKPDGHLNDTGPGAKITNAEATDCLRRYRDMAKRMEAMR